MALNITAAERVGDYALRLSFDDGTVQTVDFGHRSHAPAWECSLCRSCGTGRGASLDTFPRGAWER